MAIAYLQKNQELSIDSTRYKLLRQLDNHRWQLEEKLTGLLCVKSEHELLSDLEKGQMLLHLEDDPFKADQVKKLITENKVEAIDMVSPHVREAAKIRYTYVKAVLKGEVNILAGPIFEKCIEDVWKRLKKPKQKPHWNTVYRWCRRFINAGQDIHGLVDMNHLKGNRHRRYDEKLLEIIEQSVSEIYMTRERRTKQDTLDHAIVLVNRENKLCPESFQLPLPTQSLVTAAVRKIPAYELCVSRYGTQYAQRKYRSVLHNVKADRVLERAEIDHTQMDLFVVDEKTSLPLGRPWLTLCLDVKSRCILGFYLGFSPPSFLTVSRCLRHVFLPKYYVRERYPDIKNEWPCFGVMENLAVDNGLEFHSNSLETLCHSFGVDIHYMPRKTPWYKGIVERVLQTLNRSTAHTAPGTTFSSIFEKDDYDPVKHAVVSLATLEEIIHTWIIDYYHRSAHRTLGQPPIKVWEEEAVLNQIPLPVSTREFDVLLGAVATRVLTHKGIELHGLFYNSPELNDFRLQYGDKLKITIRYDEGDIGSIFAIDPKTSEATKVPAIKQSYAKGMSLWQHKVCRRFSRRYMPTRSDIEALAEAKQSIRKLIEKDIFKKKTKSRSRMKRFQENMGLDDQLTNQTSNDDLQVNHHVKSTDCDENFGAQPNPDDSILQVTDIALLIGAKPSLKSSIQERITWADNLVEIANEKK